MNPGGFCVAASYIFIVVFVYGVTAVLTKPDYVGYDWIPFTLLSFPWSRFGIQLFLPGLAANVVLMYLLGTLMQAIWSRAIKTRD